MIDKYYFQFDTHFFKRLCRDEVFFEKFHRVLEVHDLQAKSKQEGFYLTPFTILETIGIKPKQINFSAKKYNNLQDFLNNYVAELRTRYLTAKEIQSDNIQVAAQSNYPKSGTSIQKNIYDLCITRVVEDDEFIPNLITHLTMDSVFKYQYKKEWVKELISTFLFEVFHLEEPLRYEVSKFRLVQNNFRINKGHFQKTAIGTKFAISNTISALNLKGAGDLLDCDIIHAVCLGYQKMSNLLKPVIGFTLDNPSAIIPRIALYKGFIEYAKNRATKSKYHVSKEILEHTGGMVVFMDHKTYESSIKVVADIEPTGNG